MFSDYARSFFRAYCSRPSTVADTAAAGAAAPVGLTPLDLSLVSVLDREPSATSLVIHVQSEPTSTTLPGFCRRH